MAMGSRTGSDTTRTALVVGAGSGIGRATAQLLSDRGVHVLGADLNVEAVRDLARDEKHVVALGDCSWDATDPESCTRMVEAAVAEAGGVDVVVSTVGWTGVTPFLDETPEYWRRIVDLNLLSAIYLSRRGGPGHARTRRQHRAHLLGGRQGRHHRRVGVLGGEGGRHRSGQVAGPGVRARRHPGQRCRARPDRDAPARQPDGE